MKELLHSNLDKVARLAEAPKWKRLLNNPYKYLTSILFRKWVYPNAKKEILRRADVFFGGKMLVAIPASTDIYLTGGKSHGSEIRLARFLIENLDEGDSFLDIGAHYGYFSLLAAGLVGGKGKVIAFEPSDTSYSILEKNSTGSNKGHITVFKNAVSDKNEEISFYEFPNLYSEYNAMDTEQFGNEEWYKKYRPQKVTVQARTIDEITKTYDLNPKIIKIDVEGAEYKVIKGGSGYFQNAAPYIIMEYLSHARGNTEHNKAAELLKTWGYNTWRISNKGEPEQVADIEAYLTSMGLDSDNIVFRK